MQNATTLPINDARAFLATMKLLTASNPDAGLMALPGKDKLRVLRTLVLAQIQVTPENQTISATALLEHRAISSWAQRRGETLRNALAAQFSASTAEEQS